MTYGTYDWTVKESVFVRALMPDASQGLFIMHDNTKAVVVRLPAWDSVGTTYFNEEKWFAGFGQSQIREMLRMAREVGGDVIFSKRDQIMSDMEVSFDKAPMPREHVLQIAHPDTANAGNEWCENCEQWFPIGTHMRGSK